MVKIILLIFYIPTARLVYFFRTMMTRQPEPNITGDYYILFGFGKDIVSFFAKWQIAQFEAKSESATQLLYGKLNSARVDAFTTYNWQLLEETETVDDMPSCVAMLNDAQVQGVFMEMCKAPGRSKSAQGDYHFLFGRSEDLLPSVAKLRSTKVFLGKLNTDQAKTFIKKHNQIFDKMASKAEENYVLFIGLDDEIPLTLVPVGKLNGVQQVVVFEEIHRRTTEMFRAEHPYLLFMGMRLSWLIDFLEEMSREKLFDDNDFRKDICNSYGSESYESVVTRIHNFAKFIYHGNNFLLPNRTAARLRLKKFLKTQTLNPAQQRFWDMYVSIAEQCGEDDASGIKSGSSVRKAANLLPQTNTQAHCLEMVRESFLRLEEMEPDTTSGHFHQIRAATGRGVPNIIEAYEASIEDSDGSPASVHDEKVLKALEDNNAILKEIKDKIPTESSLPEDVSVTNMLSKKDIANSVFDASYRAMARFMRPIDEVAIEKVHRLRCDGVEWKYIGRTIYREENGKDISEEDLPTYVDSLRKQHKRQYPDHYPTEK